MVNGSLSRSACLKGSSARNCFVSFPHHWRVLISPTSIPTFQLESIDRSIIVSWGGQTHDHEEGSEEDFIFITFNLLKSNGFHEGETVIVRQIQCPLPCTNLSMSISSITDWEELLLNIDTAQKAFLSQFRVITIDQTLPLWLEGGSLIYLKVIKTSSPSFFGLLQQNTQVEIIPPFEGNTLTPSAVISSKEPETKHLAKTEEIEKLWKVFHTVFLLLGYGKKGRIVNEELYIGLRIIPYALNDCLQNSFMKLLHQHPCLVVISQQHLRYSKYAHMDHIIGKVTKVKESTKTNEDPQTHVNKAHNISGGSMYVVIVVWEKLKETLIGQDLANFSSIDLILKHRTCIVSDSLRRMLSLQVNSIIILDTIDCSIQNKNYHIDICPLATLKQKNEISTNVKALLRDTCNSFPIILNNLSILNLPLDNQNIDILICIRNNDVICLDKSSVHLLSVNIISQPSKLPFIQKNLDEIDKKNKHLVQKLLINENILSTLLKYILLDLNLESNYPAFISQFTLVQGSKGSGKTVLVESLVEILTQKPYYTHCEIVNLKLLKGKKVESIQKVLLKVVKEAINNQPSLIVLEDLDYLAPAQSNVEEERGSLYDYVNHMSSMIKGILNQVLESTKFNVFDIHSNIPIKNFVTIVSTCCSRDMIHPLLSNPKGRHTFPRSLRILPVTKEERIEILKYFLCLHYRNYVIGSLKCEFVYKDIQESLIFNFNKEVLVLQIEGLTPMDIKNLALRIFLTAQTRWENKRKLHEIGCKEFKQGNFSQFCKELNFTNHDLTNALDGFVSLSSKALKLPEKQEIEKNVGGMRSACAALEEMILWPAKYPSLFSQTSLRLRSGILLYGPPGCGKTLLANSFAAKSRINFITVKGPELLSKYIGQSEKAVRETFERAQSAKPCILFFDEFESIAPRRGHDNTGVTDRVVNQLLTQMDGVEGLSEVYVLAATSRPELIDPALLRPGRLDKGVYCPIPDQQDREEILSVLSKEIQMGENIDFKEVSLKTNGFTGADLQSLLSTAQVKAVQESLGRTLYEGAIDEEGSVDRNPFVIDTDFVNKAAEEPIEGSKDVLTNFTENRKLDSRYLTIYNKDKSKKVSEVIYVMKRHIFESLNDVRSSISETERLKYQRLHLLFTNSREKVFGKVIPGKKETMA